MLFSTSSLLCIVDVANAMFYFPSQDWFTTKSLRAANIQTARFVMNKAEEAGLVDTPMLNGMLQVYSASGSIRSALAVHEKFDKYKLVRFLRY